jgi:sugar lactone lactonase YvrE
VVESSAGGEAFTATLASTEAYQLAEGPLWDPVRDRVLWVDIDAGTVLSGVLHDGQVRQTSSRVVDRTVGAVVCSADNRLLVAGARTLTVVEPDGVVTPAIQVIPTEKRSRLNDGACDPAGRFLVGSLASDDREGDEVLCRLEDDGTLTVIDSDLTVSNGLAWSPDGATMYSVDSGPGVVWVRDYDARDGQVGQRRELLSLDGEVPDGLCVDVDGNLWIAVWGAGQVRCYSTSGERLATVHVPAPHTSSVAFVGTDLDTLLITTASNPLTSEQRQRFALAGHLFTARVPTHGLPATPWSGTWP